MAVNITVFPLYSPRIIQVDEPQTEATIQDLHDAIRAWEDSEYGQYFPYLIDTAGKEELGGGVTVGLTAQLQNAQVYFPSRSTPIDASQVCSTADPDGRVLISAGSTFQTDGLVRGDMVFNASTGGMATIIEINSETQLTHLPLTGGSRNDWQVNDDVWTYNNPQCDVSGGNLTAVDHLGDPITSILHSPLAQVVRTASSSATLQELQDIQYSSYNGGVSYDETSSYTGITYPNGTPRQPVNNSQDAYDLCIERGFVTIYIIDNMTVGLGIPWEHFRFIGSGKDRSLITLPDAASVTECTFVDAEVTGYLDGECTLLYCVITDLQYVTGYIESCVLSPGTIVLAGLGTAHFLNCQSGVPGVDTPTVDCGGSGQALAMRNYNGGVRLTNKSGPESCSIDLQSGQVRIDLTTVTNGTIVVRGDGKLVDDLTGDLIRNGATNGSATFVNETSNYYFQIMMEFMQKKLLTVKKYIGLS